MPVKRYYYNTSQSKHKAHIPPLFINLLKNTYLIIYRKKDTKIFMIRDILDYELWNRDQKIKTNSEQLAFYRQLAS